MYCVLFTKYSIVHTTVNYVLRMAHSHQPGKEAKASLSIALNCTTGRWSPASARTDEGPVKDDLIPL